MAAGFVRRRPAHGVMAIDGQSTIAFVTLGTKFREPWLASDEVHRVLREVWTAADAWVVGRYVVMPDHIHLFAGEYTGRTSLDAWVKYWKSQFTRAHGRPDEKWQPGHWDTRLRGYESYNAKWQYVRNNPVRHGLVEHADQWPYQGEILAFSWD